MPDTTKKLRLQFVFLYNKIKVTSKQLLNLDINFNDVFKWKNILHN